MNFSLGVLLALVFLYVLTPLVLWAVVARLTGGRPGERRFGLVVGLSVAPVVIGLVVALFYQRLPDRDDWFYVTAPVVVILILGTVCGREVIALPSAISGLYQSIKRRFSPATNGGFIGILMVILIAAGAYQTLKSIQNEAIVDTDALEYATLGRHIERKESLKFYPMLKADDKTGFYTPCTHPPTYPALLTWHYIVQNDNWSFGYGRLIGLWAMASMSLSLVYLTRRQPIHLALLPVLGMYSCTGLFKEFSNGAIDPMCLATFLGCLVVVLESLNTPTWRNAAVTGIMLGFLASIHSVGVFLLCVVSGAAFLLIRAPTWRQRIGWVGLACVVGIALCSNTYLRNQRVRGRPLGDDVAVWNLKVVSFQDFMREERGLVTMTDRLKNGVLRMWTQPSNYGLLPWLVIVGALLSLKRHGCRRWMNSMRSGHWRHWSDGLRLSLTVFTLYFLGVVFSWLIGMDLLIKNFRYQFPMVLMLAVFLAHLIPYKGFAFGIDARILRMFWSAVFFALLVLCVVWPGIPVDFSSKTTWMKFSQPFMPKDSRLAKVSTYGALQVLRKFEADASADARLLSFSTNYPAFYSKKPILSEFDPEMISLYQAKSFLEVRRFLQEHGVTHVLATPYYWPTFDRTIAKRFFEDKASCTIIAESDGWRLARVLP